MAFVRLLVQHGDIAEAFQFTASHSSTRYLPSIALSSHFNDPRQDLNKLRAQLQASGSSAVLGGAKAALHGMGGVGKTQLALQYCHRFQNDYAGMWWLQAQPWTVWRKTVCCFAASKACHSHRVKRLPGDECLASPTAELAAGV